MLVAAPLGADADPPNHVRIIWNVATGDACGMVRPLSDPARFVLPGGPPCDGAMNARDEASCTTHWCRPVRGMLNKGDYVTVYAYNYNAVSYKPLAPLVTTVKPEEPIAITVLSAVLQAAGFRPVAPAATDFRLEERPPDGCRPFNAANCLNAIGVEVRNLRDKAEQWNTGLRDGAKAIATARPNIPANLRDPRKPGPPEFGITGLSALACKFSVVDARNPLGDACEAKTGWVQEVSAALGLAAALVREFDSAYDPSTVSNEHVIQRDRYKRAIDGWVDYLTANQTGVRSEVAAGVAQLSEDLAALKSYRTALDSANSASYAVELPRQGPVGRLHTLVFALPLRLTGEPESAPAQLTRTYSIEVSPDRPVAMASAGVVWLPQGPFDFQRLALEQLPAATPATLTRRLIAIDTDEYREVTALLATHVRIPTESGSAYFTLGTTGDRKIFRSALVGLSWFFPQWRSVLTIGRMGAEGSLDKDVQAVIDKYTVNGVVSDALNLGQVFPEERWRWTWTIGWTLTPF
jgi:hypothetical protein